MYFINTEDKGRGIAAGEKIEAGEFVMLNSGTYGKLKEDPAHLHEGRITRTLKSLEKKGEIPSQL